MSQNRLDKKITLAKTVSYIRNAAPNPTLARPLLYTPLPTMQEHNGQGMAGGRDFVKAAGGQDMRKGETFQDVLHGKNGRTAFFHWQLMSFFALEADDQISLIGPCKNWFLKEREDLNPGANYLFGIVTLFLEYGCWTWFSDWAPGECEQMEIAASGMYWKSPLTLWSHEGLRESEYWSTLRLFSREILLKCELTANPRQQPYDCLRELEINWQDYREFRIRRR